MRSGFLVLCGIAILVGIGPMTGARGGDEAAEIWRFSDGDIERAVDVTEMPEFVRAALVERLAAQGFERTNEGDPNPERGRDLVRDVRELVAHGGRFPRPAETRLPAEAGARQSPSFLARLARRIEHRVGFIPFLGGLWGRAPGPHGGSRFVAGPPGSAARALGFEPGDVLLEVNTRPVTVEALPRLEQTLHPPLQLRLRVMRRLGRIETWKLSFQVPAGSPRSGGRR